MDTTTFAALLQEAVQSFLLVQEGKACQDKLLRRVAIHCVNRILLSKNIDRLQDACNAFHKFPDQFQAFKGVIALFCGGFSAEKDSEGFICAVDVRGTEEQIKIVSIDKDGNAKFSVSPKGRSGALQIQAAAEQWELLRDKAETFGFTKPKQDPKKLSYVDIIKRLRKLSDNEKWSDLDKNRIQLLFSHIQTLIDDESIK